MIISDLLVKEGVTRNIYTAAELVLNGTIYINKEQCLDPLREITDEDDIMVGRNRTLKRKKNA
jgi:predicted rRNA methylase YqxC with S4 and FtsJ domains